MTTLNPERTIEPPPAPPRSPGLELLSLTPEHLRALATQGFVEAYGGKQGLHFKIRFRAQGRQVVRSLGRDASFAQQVRQEIGDLQTARRLDRQLQRDTREVRAALRATKRQLQPLLAAAGLKFHGYALRQPVPPSSGPTRHHVAEVPVL